MLSLEMQEAKFILYTDCTPLTDSSYAHLKTDVSQIMLSYLH